MTPARLPAVGGTRDVPAPDDVARDYLLLGLRLDQHLPGTVDGYFGPAELKARVDMEPLRPPARLAEDALALRSRLDAEVPEPDRRHWLDLQLIAAETQARVRAGESIPYLDQVERCLCLRPERRDDATFERAGEALDELLPGHDSLAGRLKAEDDAWTVPVDRVPAVVEALVARFRARAASLYALPEGESLRVSLVRGQPWSGYNWYDGGYRSRVDINLDLPIRLPNLVATVAHETYPGHHLEHAEKERRLVEELGRLESSILLINAPECLISEGLANLGVGIAARPEELPGLLAEHGDDRGAAAGRRSRRRCARPSTAMPAIARQRAILGEARVNAALDGPRRRRVARPGRGLPGRCRPEQPGNGGQAPRVHLAPAVAPVRLRLHRGRGDAPAVARGGPAGRARREVRSPAHRVAAPHRRSAPRRRRRSRSLDRH